MANIDIFVKFSMVLVTASCYFHSFYSFEFGVGRFDCTGPAVETVFVGYGQKSQKGEGLHSRLYSRAFIIDDGIKRVVFVIFEGGLMVHPIKRDVLIKLQKRYGNMYTIDNVAITAQHTHSSPGGYVMNVIYDLPNSGFVKQTFDALVNGIYQSIVKAHDNMQVGRIFIDETQVFNVSVNRSPISYLENPAEERAKYEHDTDKTLTQMRFVGCNNELVGAINWYALHAASLNYTNHLVSSDNLGYAALLLEKQINVNDLPGQGNFVGAFAQTNEGDVSPNIEGPKCQLSGKKCDDLTSSCPASEGFCIGSGPGKDQFESVKIIGTRLFEGAWKLIEKSDGCEIYGKISYIHQFVDMPSYKTTYFNAKTKKLENVTGCVPAMGYGAAAGTTDGPGYANFKQGNKLGTSFWNTIRNLLFVAPPDEDIHCHYPKPILIPTGRVKFPYQWQPKIVSTQLIKIGDVLIVAVPGELTTMSGRRLKQAVRNAMAQNYGTDVQVITSCLTNLYGSYIATPEEYQLQRYEGSSTIYGPHTLPIYIDQYERLCRAMVNNETIESGPSPPNEDMKLISILSNEGHDGKPFGRNFGDVVKQPKSSYKTGQEVSVLFISGNPRNDLKQGKTYLTVEYESSNGTWTVVAVDSNFETKFKWKQTNLFLGHSTAEVLWEIPHTANEGNYRICHFGASRDWSAKVQQYNGTSHIFAVSKGQRHNML